MTTGHPSHERTFDVALNKLFEGSPRHYSNRQVAEAINERARKRAEGLGEPWDEKQGISEEYLRVLRKPDGPQQVSLKKVALIAEFFMVPTDYFVNGTPAAAGLDAELDDLIRLRKEQAEREAAESQEVLALARSAGGLNQRGQKMTLDFIKGLMAGKEFKKDSGA